MTKAEKKEIKECIDLLMEDECQFQEAVGRLCRLVGMRYPVWENRNKGKAVNIKDILIQSEEEG